jgi:hypothetical protein
MLARTAARPDIDLKRPFTYYHVTLNSISLEIMRSILAFGVLAAVLSFCNFSEKLKQGSETSSSGPGKPQTSNQSAPRPAFDREALKQELLSMENDMTEAALNGDITILAKNTTDDFEITGADGKVQNKNQALQDVKREKNIRGWAITDGELVSATEDSAVLRYVLNVTLKTGQSGRAKVTDTFVKRDGRWLIQSEQQTLIK